MSARYTRAEFEEAGLTIQECDGGPFDLDGGPYWFPCAYHGGYIDGFNEGKSETAEGPFHPEQRVKISTGWGTVTSVALLPVGWVMSVEWDDGTVTYEHADTLDPA